MELICNEVKKPVMEAGDIIRYKYLKGFDIATNIRVNSCPAGTLPVVGLDGCSFGSDPQHLISKGDVELYKASDYDLVLQRKEGSTTNPHKGGKGAIVKMGDVVEWFGKYFVVTNQKLDNYDGKVSLTAIGLNGRSMLPHPNVPEATVYPASDFELVLQPKK